MTERLMDDLIWLVNFPATHGFVMFFIAGFAMAGLMARSFRNPARGSRRPREPRSAHGDPPAPGDGVRIAAGTVQMWGYQVLAVVILAGAVIGVLSSIMGPITAPDIRDHGVSATGTVDGDEVTFTTADGVVCTLPFDAMAPPQAPRDG